MNTTKTITTVTTWRDADSGHFIQHESDNDKFYVFDKNHKITGALYVKDAEQALTIAKVCTDYCSWEHGEYSTNPQLLVEVLTQFLHKNNDSHEDESHN